MSEWILVPKDRFEVCVKAFSSFLGDVGNQYGSYQWDRVDELEAMLAARPAPPADEAVVERVARAKQAVMDEFGSRIRLRSVDGLFSRKHKVQTMTFDWYKRGLLEDLIIGADLQGRPLSLPMNRFSPSVRRAYHWAAIRHAWRVYRESPRLFPRENFRRIVAIHLEGIANAKR